MPSAFYTDRMRNIAISLTILQDSNVHDFHQEFESETQLTKWNFMMLGSIVLYYAIKNIYLNL